MTNRVKISASGGLCLTDAQGAQLSCVTAAGTTQQPTGANGTGNVSISGDITTLSDTELAQLSVKVAAEQLRRAQMGK